MTKFNTYLESNDFDLLKRFFEEHGELQHYRKGNFFARQGEYSSQAALIKDGTFAYTHIDNEGKEHYVGFVFPDEFVADYTTFMRHSASQVNIVALKPSTIFSVNRQALHDFYNTDMETLRYNCLMAENLYEMVYSRLLESYCKTPEERYRRLTTRYPKIEQEIPLCKIASFLNVTPETISHIRKKIVKNS